jgi:hypothetical protein
MQNMKNPPRLLQKATGNAPGTSHIIKPTNPVKRSSKVHEMADQSLNLMSALKSPPGALHMINSPNVEKLDGKLGGGATYSKQKKELNGSSQLQAQSELGLHKYLMNPNLVQAMY